MEYPGQSSSEVKKDVVILVCCIDKRENQETDVENKATTSLRIPDLILLQPSHGHLLTRSRQLQRTIPGHVS